MVPKFFACQLACVCGSFLITLVSTMAMQPGVSLSFYTEILRESERVAQATFAACMEERLGGPNFNLSRHAFDPKQLKYLGKRMKLDDEDTTHVEPEAKRPKTESVYDKCPKGWANVEGKVVVCCVDEEADNNHWYALTPEQLDAELKPIAERFPLEGCENDMLKYMQAVYCVADYNFKVIDDPKHTKPKKPLEMDKPEHAMTVLFHEWDSKYMMKETRKDCAGRLRQLWRPLCVIMTDIYE